METEKNMGLLLDFTGEKAHQICSFMWPDNFWIMYHSKRNLERMLRDLIEEAERSQVLIATNGLMYKFL